MSKTEYWADTYLKKLLSPVQAIDKIKSGQRVFIGSGCGEPQILTRTLAERTNNFSGLEIVRLLTRETTSLTAIADKTRDTNLNIRSIYLGATDSMLFTTRKMPLHVALVQASPVDDFGWMSLGIAVDVTMAAARSADLVIVQINPNMPRIMGQSFIHVNDIDFIVEHEEPLLAVQPATSFSEAALQIGSHIAAHIEDGATLQIGLDAMSQATVQALSSAKGSTRVKWWHPWLPGAIISTNSLMTTPQSTFILQTT